MKLLFQSHVFCVCVLGSEAKCIYYSEKHSEKVENTSLEKAVSYLQNSIRKCQLALASGSYSFNSFELQWCQLKKYSQTEMVC